MPNRSVWNALGQFLGDLIQGRNRKAIDGLSKAVGEAQAARIAKQAGIAARFLPSTKPEPKEQQTARDRQPGEDGDLIFCSGSSNVHSFTWWRDSQTLQVRFLGGESGNRAGPGPMYSYFNVPENVFQQFKSAARTSAGGAVWDELRIRGSIFGHRFDYSLVGAGAGGHVPRKQTGFGLKPRELKHGGRVMRSKRPGTGRFKGE